MTSADCNDLIPAQEKLEWVTPKISLMEMEDTYQKITFANEKLGVSGPGNVPGGTS